VLCVCVCLLSVCALRLLTTDDTDFYYISYNIIISYHISV